MVNEKNVRNKIPATQNDKIWPTSWNLYRENLDTKKKNNNFYSFPKLNDTKLQIEQFFVPILFFSALIHSFGRSFLFGVEYTACLKMR